MIIIELSHALHKFATSIYAYVCVEYIYGTLEDFYLVATTCVEKQKTFFHLQHS